ncbi:MAG: CCA tRNA nucleotidyltransferase [Anaerolineae bacterium]|nr:CCA tRNA nucleotidyltransferase [Anaerolineae bacterium]
MQAASHESQIAHAVARMPLIRAVLSFADRLGVDLYLVGGTVRDLLLGVDTHDLDFAVDGDGLRIARAVADAIGGAYVTLDAARRTGRVVLTGDTRLPGLADVRYMDFASFRADDLEADLRDRDFTINAMAVGRGDDGALELIDPLGGRSDLADRVLRAASARAFLNDPVRTLRAVRQSAQFGYQIERQTRTWLTEAVPYLAQVSAERVRDEWFKILGQRDASQAIAELRRLGLLFAIAPPLARLEEQDAPTQSDALAHALAAVEVIDRLWDGFEAGGRRASALAPPPALEPILPHIRARYAAPICDERSYLALLRCATLLHDVGGSDAPGTEAIPPTGAPEHAERGAAIAAQLARRWRCSTPEREMLETAIRAHARLAPLAQGAALDRRAIYRYFLDTGVYGLDAAFVALADYGAAHGARPSSQGWRQQVGIVAQLWRAYLLQREQVVDPPPLVSGRDLIALGMAPGPRIGALLAAVREAQAAGEVTTRAQALARARAWIDALPPAEP